MEFEFNNATTTDHQAGLKATQKLQLKQLFHAAMNGWENKHEKSGGHTKF